jgi:hypothetical protein
MESTRIARLNDVGDREGQYVLYWMQRRRQPVELQDVGAGRFRDNGPPVILPPCSDTLNRSTTLRNRRDSPPRARRRSVILRNPSGPL